MHAIHITQPRTGIKDLKWTQVEKPVIQQNEVLIKMKLRPIHPADVLSLVGVYSLFNSAGRYPAVPGVEGMGVVEQVGSDVKSFKVGQRVVPILFKQVENGNGSWQEYIAVPETEVTAVPDTVSDKDASHYFCNPFTVYGMLDVLKVPKGEFLVQTAAGSALGRQMIQVCKSRGIKTINLVRRKEIELELKEIGADYVVCTESENVVERVAEITNKGLAYAAVDCVGGETTDLVTHCLRDGGKAILYGLMDGLVVPLDAANLLFRRISLQGFALYPWYFAHSPSERTKMCDKVWEWFSSGVVTPHSGEVFKLEDASKAMEAHNKSARGGKVLLSSE